MPSCCPPVSQIGASAVGFNLCCRKSRSSFFPLLIGGPYFRGRFFRQKPSIFLEERKERKGNDTKPKDEAKEKKPKNRSNYLDNSTPKDRAGIGGISPVVRLWEILYFISPHQQPPCLSFPFLFLFQLDELLMTPATSKEGEEEERGTREILLLLSLPPGQKKKNSIPPLFFSIPAGVADFGAVEEEEESVPLPSRKAGSGSENWVLKQFSLDFRRKKGEKEGRYLL